MALFAKERLMERRSYCRIIDEVLSPLSIPSYPDIDIARSAHIAVDRQGIGSYKQEFNLLLGEYGQYVAVVWIQQVVFR
jgi:hypothetical protein